MKASSGQGFLNILFFLYVKKTERIFYLLQPRKGRPWEEDDLEGELHIGDAIFGLARPCPRWYRNLTTTLSGIEVK